jgi:hypothetical protein
MNKETMKKMKAVSGTPQSIRIPSFITLSFLYSRSLHFTWRHYNISIVSSPVMMESLSSYPPGLVEFGGVVASQVFILLATGLHSYMTVASKRQREAL